MQVQLEPAEVIQGGFNFLVGLLIAAISLWLLRFIMAIRDSLWRGFLFGGGGWLVAVFVHNWALRNGLSQIQALLAAASVAMFVIFLAPRRSRHIPARIRREKISEWEAKHGKKFDSSKSHLDHRVAFSGGGGHTRDNLRVIDKKKNLRKGKKLPGLLDWD